MTRTIGAICAATLLFACAKNQGFQGPQGPSLAPSSNVFLRNSFDTDPSSYVGRFLPEGQARLDESNGMELACSDHISYRFVDGGGVRYTELLNTSSEVSARFGVPVVANGKGNAATSGVVRVEYELTGKMVGEIADPVAFNECCADQPDQCTTRYVGEFLQGTGKVYHLADRSAYADANVITPQVGVDVTSSHGTHWERVVEFPNPVYFAFKTAGTTHEQPTGTMCTDWHATLPTERGKQFVVGVSRNDAKTETAARNRAMMNATSTAAMSGMIELPKDESELEALLETLVGVDIDPRPGGVTPDDWCVELVRSEKGDRYRAKVLAYVADAR